MGEFHTGGVVHGAPGGTCQIRVSRALIEGEPVDGYRTYQAADAMVFLCDTHGVVAAGSCAEVQRKLAEHVPGWTVLEPGEKVVPIRAVP